MANSLVAPLVLSTHSIPKISCNKSETCQFTSHTILSTTSQKSIIIPLKTCMKNARRSSSTRLYAAGLSEIEPDLNEDPVDRWRTNGVEPEEFEYGKWDDHHTYFEGDDKGTFWGSVAEDYAAIEPPTGFQGLISWLFLPAIATGMYFDAPDQLLSHFEYSCDRLMQGEYLYIGAAIFTVVFCIIEMNKPSEPHNFEPQIYNMERGARDKLISDYNTMDIWEFNEKYDL
ncbi:hypothetical protein Leryth_023565 [Lithospermum erythrorhizon]|nr:hypothetical protein Leryth_023565 [Lithospermum erythrorhizon]